jgi:CMP/dCMP kinase
MIVTISRQMGSGGAVVGQGVARRLGLRYADRDILAAAARALEAEASELEPLEERVAHMFARGSVDTLYAPLTFPAVGESELFATERDIVESIAARGNAIIVGRGAAHVLNGRADLVRVFLHAPLAVRVARACEAGGLRDEHEAADVVRRSDERRARFIRSLTGRDWRDADLYDLCLNTDAIGLDATVDVAIDFLKRIRGSNPEPGRSGVTREDA